MSYTVCGVDVVADCVTTKAEVERVVVEHFAVNGVGVQPTCVQLNGPAGGNPVVDLVFETEADALKGMTAYCDGDENTAREVYLNQRTK